MKQVVLVNESGEATGIADAIAVHSGDGLLHRAFSVYVFRRGGRELLIQQRSRHKMLWPLVWANTCCSHPLPDETAIAAGQRRLREECGFTCPLREAGSFVYRAVDPAGRGVEHEHVTILVGELAADVPIKPNSNEAANCFGVLLEGLKQKMQSNPSEFAPWFHLGMEQLGWEMPPLD